MKDIEDITNIDHIDPIKNTHARRTLDQLVKMSPASYQTSLLLTKTLSHLHRQEKLANRGNKTYKGRPLLTITENVVDMEKRIYNCLINYIKNVLYIYIIKCL